LEIQKNSLKDRDFTTLAEKTASFSGSDISAVVQDALMQPVRDMQAATHFRKIQDAANKNDYVWVPCKSNDSGAKAMKLLEFPENEQAKVQESPLNINHFLRILENAKPSVGKDDIQRYVDWTNEFGQDG